VSRFFSSRYDKLTPYTPGEQPKDMQYVKLNTNESPFPPSPKAQAMAKAAAETLQLYSDPECRDLVARAAEHYGVACDELLFTNGSDEALNFAFMAFCDNDTGIAFPDISYGFYPVFAELNNIDYLQIPLREDYSIAAEDYIGLGRTVIIANPNAPTGLCLGLDEIERIVLGNGKNLVIIDEAYVDFGGESAVPLTKKYDNLLVVQTFSKSRSLAGARLGVAIGSSELIRDLNTVKYSTNPYNVNRMTMAAGIGALEDKEYFENCRDTIVANRAWTTEQLRSRGFGVIDSKANFIFAAPQKIGGRELYLSLKRAGVLVRHFDKPRLSDFVRITIGSMEQMQTLIKAIDKIMEESK